MPEAFVAAGHASQADEVAHMHALYEDEVAYADEQFGRFLDLLRWLDLYEDSYVILLADHGEEFGEHGGFEHGETLFGEVLRVPLLVKYPGGRWAGGRVADAVSLVDVVPTLLEELAVPSRIPLDGQKLPAPGSRGRGRAIYAEVAPARDPALRPIVDLRGLFAGTLGCVENRSGMDRRGLPAARWAAYALDSDPGETRPLTAEQSLARCRRLFEGFSAGRETLVRDGRTRLAAPSETLDQLRALGYLR